MLFLVAHELDRAGEKKRAEEKRVKGRLGGRGSEGARASATCFFQHTLARAKALL